MFGFAKRSSPANPRSASRTRGGFDHYAASRIFALTGRPGPRSEVETARLSRCIARSSLMPTTAAGYCEVRARVAPARRERCSLRLGPLVGRGYAVLPHDPPTGSLAHHVFERCAKRSPTKRRVRPVSAPRRVPRARASDDLAQGTVLGVEDEPSNPIARQKFRARA
jgi:hypothetical protein